MANSGWQLNVHQERSYEHGGIVIRITGKNQSLNLAMFSGKLLLGWFRDEREFFETISRTPFEIKIEHVAQNFFFANPEMPMARLASDWDGLLEIRKPEQVGFNELYGFNEKSAIFIPEAKILSVQEHLDAIRSIQQPLQDEIMKMKLNDRKQSKEVFKLVAV